ncbi:hypothetical protein V1264_009633 [Littorina saxatilis]|uniref:Uncharacterized protein n=1 Tax=Littorina saxatilis TaxID=31220 RepID=A0AAN9AS49_9CAEN
MTQGINQVEKRSLSSTLSHYGHSLHDAAVKLGRHLHNGVTVSACTAICNAGAIAILEGAAIVAAALCPPLCDYTLAHAQTYITNHGR